MARLLTAEEVLAALIESLVNPILAKIRPFGGVKAAEHGISAQMEAVTWLYNHYLFKEIPNLVALDWEDVCNKTSLRQTRLSKFMGSSGVAGSRILTLTEQKVKNACEAAKALQASSFIRGTSSVTKVCVCLLNFRQDKCVLVLGATTVGMWSFLEKNLSSQFTKDTSCGTLLSNEELAFQAVEEQTGIKSNVLQLQDSFLINDDLNEAGGRTKFYIMLCSGTFDLSSVIKLKKVAWVSLEIVLSMAREPLIDTSNPTVRSNPAIHYFHLRPFCSSIDSWLTRQKEVKSLDQPKHGLEKIPVIPRQQRDVRELQYAIEPDVKDLEETLLGEKGGITDMKRYKELEDDKQRQLLNVNVNAVGLSTHSYVPTGGCSESLTRLKAKTELLISSTGGSKEELSTYIQKRDKAKQKQICSKVNAVIIETDLLAASPQSSALLKNRTEPSALTKGGSAICLWAFPNKQIEDKARQVNQTVNLVPNGSPQSLIKIKKREEEHILDKAGAFLSLKTAYRNVRKRRKALSKELREHTLQTDVLYKQIEECDTDLATLMGGGKTGLQLAIELCRKDSEKQISSDLSIDCSQPEAHMTLLIADRADTTNKKRPFHMLKSSIQELNEVCTKNEWPMPSYRVHMCRNNQGNNVFSGKVRIRNNDFELSETGEASDTAKQAKLSAAAYMLSTLHRLRARNGMI
ncbi:hypothetical protein L7F22_054464 [Adiantum nelumboides]|nr:hypothetical protein [Adiantum nelumboides]